jgi:hypothetical protein
MSALEQIKFVKDLNNKNEFLFDDLKEVYNSFYSNGFEFKFDDQLIFNKNQKKINVVIGVKGREAYLKATIKYLNSSIEHSGMQDQVNLIICEHDVRPYYKLFCEENKIDYGFIDLNKSNTEGMYSRSLVYNMSVKCFPKSDWWLLHDCDLLVPVTFFNDLKPMMEKSKTWIQPYSNKMVLNMSPEHTIIIQQNNKNVYDLDKDVLPHVRKNLPGAVGGSLLIEHERYCEVGGYDHELFYGYAPEDAIFWFKLECLYKRIENHKDWYCHFGSAEYSDTINMYHQWHEPETVKNPLIPLMLKVKQVYMDLNHDQIKELITLKKQYFLKA